MAAAAISLRTLPSAAPYMTAFGVILGTALAARYGGWYIWLLAITQKRAYSLI